MDEEKEEESNASCKACRRELVIGIDAVSVIHGVIGPRGFVPLEEATFFCDEDCLERWVTDTEPEKLKRRIP